MTFIILTIISNFVFKAIKKRINNDLSYSKILNVSTNQYEITREEEFDYFSDLKLNRNLKKASIYLIVGFTSGSDMFIDFSLAQYCFECYKDYPEMMILLMHLLVYFKSEKKRFDCVLRQYQRTRDESSYGYFIYIQSHRVKIFRQVTSTDSSSSTLNELRLLSKDLENQMKAFWSLEVANTNTLEELEVQQRHLNNLWDESIEDNWNSTTFREEHIHFLIESCTDFQRAVKMESTKEKIDILRDDRDDMCFLSLIICFPCYYNNKIVDTEGNFIQRKKRDPNSAATTTTTSSSQNEKLSYSSNEYDMTYEEQIANTLVSYGKLRLSIQNALNSVKPSTGKFLICYAITSIVFSLVSIISIFAIYVNTFDSFNDWNKEVGVLVELRMSYAKSFLCLSILYGKETNRFNLDTINCTKTGDINHYFFDQSVKFDDLSLMYIEEARKYYSDLMSAILDLSVKKVDISTLTSLLFDPSINSTVCYLGNSIKHVKWSMEQVLNFEILSFAVLSDDEDVVNWFDTNTYWCHDITTFPNVENMFGNIQDALSSDLSDSSISSSKRIKLEMLIIGPFIFVLFVFPLPFIIYMYSNEINKLIRLMLSTENEHKEQARKNIALGNSTEDNNIIPPISKISFDWKFIIYSFCSIFSFCAIITFMEMILYSSMRMTEKLRNFGFWSGYFSSLRSYLIEILIEVMNAIYLSQNPQNYLTSNDFEQRIFKILKDFEEIIYVILNDTPECPSSMGQDKLIDDLVLNRICDNPNLNNNLHDIYQCASLNRHMSAIHALVIKIVENINSYDGIFQGEELSNLYHIIFGHVISKINDIGDRFISLQKEETHSYSNNLLIYFFCGLIFVCIYSFLMFLIINNFKRIFNVAICLIRRLSPVGLINNSELTNYLLYKKSEEIEMSVTHTIFNNSFDGIICMNLDGIVEIINKSFINDYGYTTEQLVGQLVSIIFDGDSRIKLENQLKLMKNHESSNYSEHVTCFTNDGRSVPSYITLFAIKGNENSLILVIRDETILLQKKKRLELAKKQSQDLLEQIMPPKVLAMLKEGKSEISFAVPSATVTFVDIVNFSGFSRDLSPQQTMGTLSTLFGAFDTWIQKFPLMTKIKLIGDNYMAACGLFAVDEDPANHATQSVDFALLVLNILEDTNIKLNSELQIRIGINSDGPIIAGVLGTENRVFDIIGDTINVASRLEHKAEPGHIMMSKKTYDLVCNCGYKIVPKGEVFLKGKGNMPAYSI